MSNIFSAVLLTIAGIFVTEAQQLPQRGDSLDQVRKVQYTNQFMVGSFGSDHALVNPSFSTFHGIRYHHTSIGIHLAYDKYQHWSILTPGVGLTCDLLRIKESAIFLQANAGYSKIWYQMTSDDNMNRDPEKGTQIEGLIGWRLPTQKVRIYFSSGFRSQRLTYTESPRWWIWGPPSGETYVARTINGIVFQVGLGI